jgi:hypothetical protein
MSNEYYFVTLTTSYSDGGLTVCTWGEFFKAKSAPTEKMAPSSVGTYVHTAWTHAYTSFKKLPYDNCM